MLKNFKKPLFWSNVASLTVVGIVAAGLVFAFNNPPATPPSGSGAIQVDGSNNVGIGAAPISSPYPIRLFVNAPTGGVPFRVAADGGSDAIEFIDKTTNKGWSIYPYENDLIFWDSDDGGNFSAGNNHLRLYASGDIAWPGSLTGGSVPWARLSSFPAPCPGVGYARAIGPTITCGQVLWSQLGSIPAGFADGIDNTG